MAIIRQYHKDTDTTYVYESESYWVPELGQSRSRRKLLGKLDPATGEIVPCGKRGPKKSRPKKKRSRYPPANTASSGGSMNSRKQRQPSCG